MLLKRESFLPILEKTLENYFNSLIADEYTVTCSYRSLFSRLSLPSSRTSFLCNPAINAIFSPNCYHQVLSLPRIWYSCDNRFPFKILKILYLLAATSRFSRFLFCPILVDIFPAPQHSEHLLIVGGNTRLRIFDFHQLVATTILKSGFDPHLISNDIQIRLDFPWLPAPELISIAPDKSFYVEPILDLPSASSINDQVILRDIEDKVVRLLSRLEYESSYTVQASDYLHDLLLRCTQNCSSMSYIDPDIISITHRVLERFAEFLPLGNFSLDISLSHGDFALGNIFQSETGVVIIDWERSGYRLRGYDVLTYFFQTRTSSVGLLGKIRNLQSSAYMDSMVASSAFRYIYDQSSIKRTVIESVYLCEELLFHLFENTYPSVASPTIGLVKLLNELSNGFLR